MMRSLKTLSLLALSLSILQGCSYLMESREVTAKRIAHPVQMMPRQIEAGLFNLMAWERIHDKGGSAHLYIEGDGLAWRNRTTPSLDPTPQNPVALNLAAMDRAENVIYLARPCQYHSEKIWRKGKPNWNGEGGCPERYWTSHRLAPEVLDSLMLAMDELRARHHIKEFHLIGYSGGANLAALLTAKRNDVASLRSVAGNLDHKTFTQIHDVSPMSGSLNATNESSELRFVPQHHFIGGEDRVVPPAVFHSYEQAVMPSACLAHTLVPDAGHEYGWVERWPELLNKPLGCPARLEKANPAEFTRPPQEFLDVKKGK